MNDINQGSLTIIFINNFHRLRDELLSQLKLNLKIKIFLRGEQIAKIYRVHYWLTLRTCLSYSFWCITGIRGIR